MTGTDHQLVRARIVRSIAHLSIPAFARGQILVPVPRYFGSKTVPSGSGPQSGQHTSVLGQVLGQHRLEKEQAPQHHPMIRDATRRAAPADLRRQRSHVSVRV
ncbi:hypothetical protein ABZW18_21230 [Streptomyces sp. NPDC004647]|uniref:hypothetical protein n=1 Tax=Streptomyces sp. NPDC004647 TaxID=3154671 RepID=UPI0033BC085C